jgi:16S rRNA (uracil1498-N3)-methyltransferase
MNGNGIEAIGIITGDHSKQVQIQISKRIEHPLTKKYKFHLAIAPTKNNERIEWMLEKCTEIGIDEITFLNCSNSERSQLKLDRFSKILISALKQSKQFHLPKLNEQVSFETFVKQKQHQYSNKFIAWCESDLASNLNNKMAQLPINQTTELIFLIGPEGDFTAAEVALAKSHYFEPVSLGKNILRTETAGIYVCSVFANHFQ